MKTIVMEIFAAIENNVHLNPDGPNWEQLKNETLAKEKEQIMKAFYADDDSNKCKFEDAEDYYNQTYKN